jgi:hypothetical protein
MRLLANYRELLRWWEYYENSGRGKKGVICEVPN